MNKIKKYLFLIPIILIVLLIMWMMVFNISDVNRVYSDKGNLNLTDWDHSDILELAGEWQFFDGLMINDISKSDKIEYIDAGQVFDKKENFEGNPYGVASYRLFVKGLDPNTNYGVQVIDEVSAYRLCVNGTDVAKCGVVAYNKEKHVPEWKGQIGFFRSDANGNAEFLMEISNFSYNYGGFWKTIKIGEAKLLNTYASQCKAKEILLFSSITTVGVFFLGLYSIKRDFKYIFYFSIICLLNALRIIFRGYRQVYNLIYNIPWDFAVRIEFFAGYLLFPAFGLFFYYLDYVDRRWYTKWFFCGFGVASFIISFFTPNEVYANLLPPYMNLVAMSLVYFIYILLKGLKKKRKSALLMLLSFLGFMPAILYDFYGNNRFSAMPYATFYMIVLFSIIVITDFFDLKKNHDYLEKAIIVDPLTGLYNRFYINDLMNQGLTAIENHKIFILFFDLDEFKAINDNYGHKIGDAVLVESGRRIKACFREADLVCRYGGDEFIVFAQIDSTSGDIKQIVERVNNNFKEPFIIENNEYFINVSIGISEYKKDDDLERVIKESDDSMYMAKKTMKNKILLYNN